MTWNFSQNGRSDTHQRPPTLESARAVAWGDDVGGGAGGGESEVGDEDLFVEVLADEPSAVDVSEIQPDRVVDASGAVGRVVEFPRPRET